MTIFFHVVEYGRSTPSKRGAQNEVAQVYRKSIQAKASEGKDFDVFIHFTYADDSLTVATYFKGNIPDRVHETFSVYLYDHATGHYDLKKRNQYGRGDLCGGEKKEDDQTIALNQAWVGTEDFCAEMSMLEGMGLFDKVTGEVVLFDGSKVKLNDLAAETDEDGDVTLWTGESSGEKFIIFND